MGYTMSTTLMVIFRFWIRGWVLKIGHVLSWCRIGWRSFRGNLSTLCRAGLWKTMWRERICIDFSQISKPICLSRISSPNRIGKAVRVRSWFARGFFTPKFGRRLQWGQSWGSWRNGSWIFMTGSSCRRPSGVLPLRRFTAKWQIFLEFGRMFFGLFR